MIAREQLENLIFSYESSELEFKSAKGGFPGSFWETYSSFANTQGGCIILGVKQTDDGFKIDNLDKATIEHLKKILWDGLNNKRKVSYNILTEKDVIEYETTEGFILLIEVPKADFRNRPVYLDNNPDNTYKREHEGDYKCTSAEIRRMFAESNIIECPMDSGFSVSSLLIKIWIWILFINIARNFPTCIAHTHGPLSVIGSSLKNWVPHERIEKPRKKD